MSKKHQIIVKHGIRLTVHEFGEPKGDVIFFIHGYAQSHLCWRKQIDSALAKEFSLICIDNRGHGERDKPSESEHYNQSKPWADDIHSVIGALELDRPVLVGWSYGGYIIDDYVATYGQDAIAGVDSGLMSFIKNMATSS